ncbi:Transcriptional regulatory protein WalR [Rhodococcus sp. T7]|nr:Transcriptional regulatory protein WalR [Rhodococcus sp. T7]KAF0965605.1 Transcriptional regulatory protein WalR [Rhodococcus sp. T7]UOT08281.1 response regulator transcription factor [Rhodococcus opacus]
MGGAVELLVLTGDLDPESVLPALGLLAHTARSAPLEASSFLDTDRVDVVLVDARADLAAARDLCRSRKTSDSAVVPVVAVLTEGGLVAVTPEWGLDDILLTGAGPAELNARLRLLAGRSGGAGPDGTVKIALGDLVIDDLTYTARVRGRPLDLTYKEFELLKHLVQHAGQVFTRAQLLQTVWGYDFFGGTRTVDVHVRRVRAKLGVEHHSLIQTVRNVGYKAAAQHHTGTTDPQS